MSVIVGRIEWKGKEPPRPVLPPERLSFAKSIKGNIVVVASVGTRLVTTHDAPGCFSTHSIASFWLDHEAHESAPTWWKPSMAKGMAYMQAEDEGER